MLLLPRVLLLQVVFFLHIGSCRGQNNTAPGIETARIYGNIYAYAYYFVDLLVGTPPQRTSVILDTGSRVCAFTCTLCRSCGNHLDAAFDFKDSNTSNWTRCGADCAGTCREDHCTYFQHYTEGSSIKGWWFDDYVSLGDIVDKEPPNPRVSGRMGCHRLETNLFYTQEANGMLGVGPSFNSQETTVMPLLQQLYKDRKNVREHIFSICLAEWGGMLAVGGFNVSYHAGPMQWIQMIATGYYSVHLTGMHVNGKPVPAIFGSAIIDSGTTYTYMGTIAYNALRGAIENYCKGHNNCGAKQSGNCWTLPSDMVLKSFPHVQVVFGNVKTTWVPSAYMYRRGNTREWCYSFQDDGPGASTVLGASWMLKQEIVFNMENRSIGIAQANCPEFRIADRPKRPTRSLMVTHSSNTFRSDSRVTSQVGKQEARKGSFGQSWRQHKRHSSTIGPWIPAITLGGGMTVTDTLLLSCVVVLSGAILALIVHLLVPKASVSNKNAALASREHVPLSQCETGDE